MQPVPGLQDAADLIVAAARAGATAGALSTAQPPRTWDFQPLPAGRPGPTVAVDGSHALLVDNGPVWVAAARAAATPWPAPGQARPEVPIEYHAGLAADEPDRVEAEFHRRGLPPPRIQGAAAWCDALRSLAELDATVAAIGGMAGGGPDAPGDLLLVDGALRGLPPHAQAIADRILGTAARHGVAVAGLAKRSGLAEGGVPLLPELHRIGPDAPWAVELEPGIWAARLHARSPHAFRIDAPDLATLARLVPLSRDAGYAGYPYPLALAHNRVAITQAHAAALKSWMANAVRRTGGADAARLLADFHDVLDRGVP